MTTKAALHSDLAIQPGEILAEELDARGMSQNDLAVAVARPEQFIRAICSGEQAISAEVAVLLEHALDGPSADFWLGLQTDYDLTVARAAYEARSR